MSSITQFVGRLASPVEAIERIGSSDEPAALPGVLPYVFDKRRPVAKAAAEAISTLLATVPVSELPWLDERLRERSTWCLSWFRVKPRELARLTDDDGAYAAVIRLNTCHPSGYVREAALRLLEARADGSEFPFLLIRLNDWVEPVRSLALSMVRERANTDHAARWVRCLPLVFRLRSLGRADHSEAYEAIVGVLKSPESKGALLEGTTSPDRRIRRVAYRWATNNPMIDARALVTKALQDPDQLVRLWGARSAVSIFGQGELPAVLKTLEDDPYMAIRRQALDIRMEALPETAEQRLVEFLFDRNVAVRGHCQYYLKKRFDGDPADHYRSRLTQDAPQLRVCLLGLGEIGSTDVDAKAVEPFLDDPRSSIRAAAIRSIGRLTQEPPIKKLVQGLQDNSGRVSREARDALRQCASKIESGVVDSIYAGAAQRHVRRNALLLAPHLRLWDGLPLLLRASCDSDRELGQLGRGFLNRWLIRSSRVATAPSKDQLKAAREALESSASQLNKSQWKEVEFVLRVAAP